MAACLLGLAAAGCTGCAISASVQSPARSATTAPASQAATSASPDPSASASPATVPPATSAGPVPPGTSARLPAGAFYVLAGRTLGSLNVWELGAGRAVTQLTHNRAGRGIDAFAASGAECLLVLGEGHRHIAGAEEHVQFRHPEGLGREQLVHRHAEALRALGIHLDGQLAGVGPEAGVRSRRDRSLRPRVTGVPEC